MYGIWITKKGWLREGGKVYQVASEQEANKKASRIRGASAVYVDDFIISREVYFLDQTEADGSNWAVYVASAFGRVDA